MNTPPHDPFFGSVKRCHGNTPWRSGSRESGRAPAERRGRSGCTELGPPASRPGSRRRPRYHGGGDRSRPDPHSIRFGCASHHIRPGTDPGSMGVLHRWPERPGIARRWPFSQGPGHRGVTLLERNGRGKRGRLLGQACCFLVLLAGERNRSAVTPTSRSKWWENRLVTVRGPDPLGHGCSRGLTLSVPPL